MKANFEAYPVNPADFIPNISDIANDIIGLFQKYEIDEAEALFVMSQVIGAIAIRAAVRNYQKKN